MHPTNLREKYETIVRDYIMVYGNDISDNISYRVDWRDGFTIFLYVSSYDGQVVASAPSTISILPSKSDVEELIATALDAIRDKISGLEVA